MNNFFNVYSYVRQVAGYPNDSDSDDDGLSDGDQLILMMQTPMMMV